MPTVDSNQFLSVIDAKAATIPVLSDFERRQLNEIKKQIADACNTINQLQTIAMDGLKMIIRSPENELRIRIRDLDEEIVKVRASLRKRLDPYTRGVMEDKLSEHGYNRDRYLEDLELLLNPPPQRFGDDGIGAITQGVQRQRLENDV